MNDNEIREQILQNDTNAFKLIYEYWYGGMCLYAGRFVYDSQAAEDVVQQVLINVWDQRYKLQEVRSLKAYLLRMIYNSCMNYLDHQKVVNKHKEAALQQLNEMELRCIEESETDHSEIIKALDTLPERNREVFRLHYFEGLKHKEIAAKLNISDRTVETHIVKGLRKLRTLLKKNVHIFLLLCKGF